MASGRNLTLEETDLPTSQRDNGPVLLSESTNHDQLLKGERPTVEITFAPTPTSGGYRDRSTIEKEENAAEIMSRQALDALEWNEKTLGKEHPDTLASLNDLAGLLLRRRKYEAAEEMFRRALEGREKVLGKEHPNTLASLNDLAGLLLRRRKYVAAEEMFRRALEGREKVLGKEHLHTLTSVSNMASVLWYQKNHEAAEEMFRRALEGWERALGKEHLATLTNLSNLADMLQYQKKYGAAEEMFRRLLEGREKALGEGHPDTMSSLDDLADSLNAQGKYNSAEEIYRRALRVNEKTLGKEHPDTLSSIRNIACMLEIQKKYGAAEEMYQRLLEVEERTLGKEHKHTLATSFSLACLYHEQKQYEPAEDMYRRVLEARERTLGEEHKHTLATSFSLACLYHEQKQYEPAEEMYRRVLEARERTLGEEHKHTLATSFSLACLYHEQKQYKLAGEAYEKAFYGYQKTLGLNHETYLQCAMEYGSMLKEMDSEKFGDGAGEECRTPPLCQFVPYEYVPLESPKHIRILHLSPGSGQDPITCALERVDTREKPHYEALSYVWGTGSASHCVFVGSHSLWLMPTLYNALRDLRQAEEFRALWIDAVCIDQKNTEEKNEQVPLMTTIYRNAARVVTYIGKEEEGMSQGLALAHEIRDYAESHLDQEPELGMQLTDNDEELCRLGFLPRYHPKWKALRHLLKLPWATRMWIVQESVQNKNMIMMYGRTVIPWNLFPDLIERALAGRVPQAVLTPSGDDFLASVSNPSPVQPFGLANIYATIKIRKSIMASPKGLPLLRLLVLCRRLRSTNTRDQVYALLGISSDESELKIRVVYSKDTTVEAVYTETAKRILETGTHLDILSAVRPNTTLKLPSWVPDWSPSTDPDHIAIPLQDLPLDPIYRASGEVTSSINVDGSRLTLRGGFFDIISYTSEEKLLDRLLINPNTPGIRGKVAWFQERLNEAKGLQAYRTEDGAIDAFWRTLIANRTHEFKEATPEYRSRFETWSAVREKLAEVSSGTPAEEVPEPSSSEYHEHSDFQSTVAISSFMTLSTTSKGYLCLTPSKTKKGDHICILMGGRMPFVVRDKSGEDFELIGEAYVHGLMKGEALGLKDFAIKNITLV